GDTIRRQEAVGQAVGGGKAGKCGQRCASVVNGRELVGIGVVTYARTTGADLPVRQPAAMHFQVVREDEGRADRGIEDRVAVLGQRRRPVIAAGDVEVQPVLEVEVGGAVQRIHLLVA